MKSYAFKNHIYSASCSPDESLLACAMLVNNRIIIVDLETGKKVGPALIGHRATVISLNYSRSGQLLVSGGYDGTVRIWDTNTRTQIGDPLIHGGIISCVSFSPDERFIAAASSDEKIRIWNIKTRTCTCLMRNSFAISIDYSKHGEILISGSGNDTIYLWNTQTSTRFLERIRTMKVKDEGAVVVKFSQNKRIAVLGSSTGVIRILDLIIGKQINSLHGHTEQISTLSFSDALVSGSEDSLAQIWNITNRTNQTFQINDQKIIFAKLLKNNTQILLVSQNTIMIRSIQ